MKNDTQRNGVKPKMLVWLVGVMLLSGCMSAKITTNLIPETNAELKSPAGQFYVAGVKYSNSNPQLNQRWITDFEQRILPMLRKECTARYPALFVNEAAGAIPLGVQVHNTTTMHTGKMMAWELGTLCICGLILPCPADSDEDYDVRAGIWNGRDGLRSATIQTSFRRENHMWISLMTPSALITIPGKTDFPKMSGTVFGFQKQMETGYQQVAAQIATALAQQVATKEPGEWVAPMGRENYPTLLPSTTPTTTLPPPGEQATPF